MLNATLDGAGDTRGDEVKLGLKGGGKFKESDVCEDVFRGLDWGLGDSLRWGEKAGGGS